MKPRQLVNEMKNIKKAVCLGCMPKHFTHTGENKPFVDIQYHMYITSWRESTSYVYH